jgi:NitT/TauT family transport system substrate-binding protein
MLTRAPDRPPGSGACEMATGVVRLAAGLLLLAAAVSPARAEELRIVGSFGLSDLPVDVAVEQKLVETQAAKHGIADLKVSFTKLGNGVAIDDALISGSADIALAGTSVMINLWDKTVGRNVVKGMMAIADSPIYFNTTDPKIKSIRDFTATDRIAMASGRGTQHALVLQMAVAQEFGWDQRQKLDDILVSMSHPDGVAMLLSGAGTVRTHATTVPFIQMELSHPGVRTILNSYDVAGGRQTLIVAYTTEKWRNDHAQLFAATYEAFSAGMDYIGSHKKQAAELFAALPGANISAAEAYGILANEDMMSYAPAPRKLMVLARYMEKAQMIKHPIGSWKDVFFDNVHDLDGD